MNITLSADDELVAKAREVAQARGTTLNELVRGYLQDLVGQLDRAAIAEEFIKLCEEGQGRSPEGWKFNREEIYDRKVFRKP